MHGAPTAEFAHYIASRSWVENDPELDPIRDDPRFREYLATLAE
jgi:hypothetical protein